MRCGTVLSKQMLGQKVQPFTAGTREKTIRRNPKDASVPRKDAKTLEKKSSRYSSLAFAYWAK